MVEGYLAGRHRSPRHGFAVEFAQHREYAPGDDIKHIDWKVYGRTERFHLKQYEQETNLVAWLARRRQRVDGLRLRARRHEVRPRLHRRRRAGATSCCSSPTASASRRSPAACGRSCGRRGRSRSSARRAGCWPTGRTPARRSSAAVLHELAGRTGRRGIVVRVQRPARRRARHPRGLAAPALPEARGGAVPHARRGRDSTSRSATRRCSAGWKGLPEILTDPLGVRDSYLKALDDHIAAHRGRLPRHGDRLRPPPHRRRPRPRPGRVPPEPPAPCDARQWHFG